jgi:protein-tyrosine phosphatase/nicotinamidase-related amidase
MTVPALLFTQCLQNDFVKPVGRYDVVPNRLHVGFAEALRLMGETPSQGPVARLMRWAAGTSDEVLRVIHIRDWHDGADPAQHAHLERFGAHCLAGSHGAAFVFGDEMSANKQVPLINSLTLNDFSGTSLEQTLAPFAGVPVRAGVVGVWTEAKVSFLCYELTTRYPQMEVAVCSALCASSSRQQHFEALDQLERILGVRVIDSLGEFIDWLGGDESEAPLLGLRDSYPQIANTGVQLSPTDTELVRYLFRDCKDVQLRVLDGGFSGNVVAAAQGTDLDGHEQVPHVVKIGARAPMGKERASFERVQQVLGNNAPAITDFADFEERGAIKYRYASMGGAFATTLQKEVQRGLPLDEVQSVLDAVFLEQLGRFYRAAREESGDLLEHYGFSAQWAPGVRQHVEQILGGPADGAMLEIVPGVAAPNICRFYEETLAHLPRRPRDVFYQAWVHGDLNGQNVILDAHKNVWLIDFFHTRRAHVLLDLLKLENDLLYIWSPVADEPALRAALTITDRLLAVEDLAASLSTAHDLPPALARTWSILGMLRGYHGPLVHSDRDPLQASVGLLRYAVHTLGFDECNPWQKRWALYAAGQLAGVVEQELQRSGQLRVDWLDSGPGPGKVGLTLLPGRRDLGRDLDWDLAALQEEQVARVVCLVPSDELASYGAGDLLRQYAARGLRVHHSPIVDQGLSSLDEMRATVRFIQDGVAAGENVVVHCVGGLGRSGITAACWLVAEGLPATAAIAEVRRIRSPRAVETDAQAEFVAAYQGSR